MTINQIIDDIMVDYYNCGYQEHFYGADGMSASGLWDAEARAIVWAGLNAPQGNFVTFGAFQGASDVLLGLVQKHRNKGNKVISIDIKHQDAWFRNVFNRARLNDFVDPIDESITKYKYNSNIPIALAFSDSWHSYKAVITEWNIVRPMLMHNGFYLFHDCSPYLLNKYDGCSEELKEEADANHELLMQEFIPEIDPENKKEYHGAESQQNFLIDFAIARILDTENTQLIELPEFNHQPRFDRTGGDWERGKTSPHFCLRGIRWN